MSDDAADHGGPANEAEASASEEATGPRCPACGGETYRRHCKYVCPAHGVVMDCADTFW